ncbi:uncharacterized protein HD556DRAFT_1314228 [Suillus plorans]|uniref:Uncharacterized protein n=1 Tax=Suillus plorans TaxID=116603 RepID=A0A9P7DAG2_9AGAM|nr:uncharacterized protein HD556DRAFT_1314228 [Suillus plorans]KAG1785444.1 hypothetical protein HD556DRAFT_1314228 [Suillus plorans]
MDKATFYILIHTNRKRHSKAVVQEGQTLYTFTNALYQPTLSARNKERGTHERPVEPLDEDTASNTLGSEDGLVIIATQENSGDGMGQDESCEAMATLIHQTLFRLDATNGSLYARSDSLVSTHTPEASVDGMREHESNEAMMDAIDPIQHAGPSEFPIKKEEHYHEVIKQEPAYNASLLSSIDQDTRSIAMQVHRSSSPSVVKEESKEMERALMFHLMGCIARR